MPRVAALVLDRLISSTVTTDGRHVVMQARDVGGNDLTFAVPCELIPSMIDRCALALTESERILRSGALASAQVTWWNSAIDPSLRDFTLFLTFGSGGTLSFDLSDHMARALLTTLRQRYETGDQPASTDPPSEEAFPNTLRSEHMTPGFV